MESFTLLKFWRGGGAGGGSDAAGGSIRQEVVEADQEEDDEGPFFDLEFAMPCNEENVGSESGEDEEEENGSTGTEPERDFDLTVSSGSTGSGTDDSNQSLSPSDDLFFRGQFVSLEPSVYDSSEPVSKLQLGLSFLKTATKLRVSVLGSKKAKSTAEINGDSSAASDQKPQPLSKFFTVKFRIEDEEVPSNPVVSLFTRDYSSRSSGIKTSKQSSDEVGSDERRFVKDVLHKYLKMIKPLYVRGSKRDGVEKLRFSEQVKFRDAGANANGGKQGNLPVPVGLRVACKHLRKSRSSSSNVPNVPPLMAHQASRRDDSLLQQQDGIQGAILHCKRSFNGSRDSCTIEKPDFIDATRPSFEGAKQACI